MLQRGERRVGGSGNAQSPVNERIHAQIPLPGGGMTPQAKSHPWLSSAPATCTHATQYGFWAARSNWSRLVASRNTRTVLRHDDTLYSYAPSPNEHRPPRSACMRRKRCCCGIRGLDCLPPHAVVHAAHPGWAKSRCSWCLSQQQRQGNTRGSELECCHRHRGARTEAADGRTTRSAKIMRDTKIGYLRHTVRDSNATLRQSTHTTTLSVPRLC